MSLPMRGEWIEILFCSRIAKNTMSLPMRGEWIEIGRAADRRDLLKRLSPCGESGLKWKPARFISRKYSSLPMRGEWIEIYSVATIGGKNESLPMRGEWIEIVVRLLASTICSVSPHAGRVD